MFLPQIAEILADERRQELRRRAVHHATIRHPSSLQRIRRRLGRT